MPEARGDLVDLAPTTIINPEILVKVFSALEEDSASLLLQVRYIRLISFSLVVHSSEGCVVPCGAVASNASLGNVT